MVDALSSNRATMAPAYQSTEIGPIPSDWLLPNLGELCEFINGDRGVNYPSKKDFVPLGIPFVNAGHLLNQRVNFSDADYITIEKFNSLGGGKYQPGDLLYCLRGSLGKFASIEPGTATGAIASSLVIVRPIKGRVTQAYLKEYFLSEYSNQMIKLWAGGAAQPNLGAQDLARFSVPLPPKLDEQELITQALSKTDALIEALAKLISKKRAIRAGATEDLLSGHTRLSGFRGDWDRKTFSGIFDFYPTATNSRADLNDSGDTYYIHYGDIHTRFHSHLDFKLSQPPRIARTKCRNAAYVRNGDWIMADASEDYDGVCKSIEVLGLGETDRVVSGLHTFLLREKSPTFVPGFKGHLGNLKSLRDQYMRVMTGMKVFGVSKAALKDLMLPVPSPKEQEAIVTILSEMAADIVALEEKLSKARLVKLGMMQQLLTGKVRLV
ncbi:restriction endonuclease subunit S [Brucella anthropi]|uniref:restriction endonuclease subunit S n=1 Tax=Brucella anthropi TaxID=529 RepID=UPI00244D7407|nr:restriction endonuclease subunit S [Brucella anthropi]MDH0369678.1 restriction endonuclease subunit S [Brucella anthropi]